MSTINLREKRKHFHPTAWKVVSFVLLNSFKPAMVVSCIMNTMTSLFYQLKKSRIFYITVFIVIEEWWDWCTWEQKSPFCTFCPLSKGNFMYRHKDWDTCIFSYIHYFNVYMQSSPLHTQTQNMRLSYDCCYFVSLLCKQILM